MVIALAQPIWNPREATATGGGALALVIDNGWASAADWKRRVATAERLIEDANESGVPVVLAFTAEKPNAEIGPFDAIAARERLNAAAPRPVPTDRPDVFQRVAERAEAAGGPDRGGSFRRAGGQRRRGGLQDAACRQCRTADVVRAGKPRHGRDQRQRERGDRVRHHRGARRRFCAAPGDRRRLRPARPAHRRGGADVRAGPDHGHRRASRCRSKCATTFRASPSTARTRLPQSRVLDDNSKRRRVGLLSEAEGDQAQPLLSPLYYIRHALEPFADLVESDSKDLAVAVPWLIKQKPAMIVMADVGTLPDDARVAAGRLDEGRRHAGALRRLAAGGRRQRRGTAAGAAQAGRARAGRHAVVDRAAAGERLSRQRAVLRPGAAVGRDGEPAGAGRADARHRRPHLGKPGRRHAAGDRRQARRRHGRAVPHRAGGDLVQPADFGHLRGNAAAADPAFAQPGQPSPARTAPAARCRPTA